MTKAARQAEKLRALNSHNQVFWRTHGQRFEKLIEQRPQVLSDALADFEDETRRRGFRETPSLEYFVEKVSKRTLSPKKRGRKREVNLRGRVRSLKDAGLSWSAIAKTLNKETGTFRTVGAYRQLFTR